MVHFVGLDVSVKTTSVCVVDDAGKVILEQKVPTDPAVGDAERGQKGDDSVRLSQHFLLQDYLAGIVDNAHRRLFCSRALLG